MIAEVRTAGYAATLSLLQNEKADPKVARHLVAILEDRRVFWEAFDAEFPNRVRVSLDHLRREIVALRGGLPRGSALDPILLALTTTILTFFRNVESLDLETLRCDSNDPKWRVFCDALAALRKSVGLQVANVASVYTIKLSEDLLRIAPNVSFAE